MSPYYAQGVVIPTRDEMLENGDMTQEEYDIDEWLDEQEDRALTPPE